MIYHSYDIKKNAVIDDRWECEVQAVGWNIGAGMSLLYLLEYLLF